MSCPACGRENPPDSSFCNGCGSRLEAPVPAAEAAAPEPRSYTPRHLAERILTTRAALEGERKQVTVLFADVKGSMELAGEVDPEDWHAILNRFFEILAAGVHRYEGTVNQYTGDGIMALFGAPIAHEDHAQRACYAALQLSDRLRDYATELRLTRGLSFSVRMGLNSGEVIVGKIGDDLRMDYTAQGHTVGLAARMEQIAEPGRVYLTEQTAELVGGYFELTDLGQLDVKGAPAAVGVYELAGAGPMRTRLDVSRERGLSLFVGRAAERERLDTLLSAAREGEGSVVGIVGQAGVGKSRLCLELIDSCRAAGVPVHQVVCLPHGSTTPLLPVRELLRSLFQIGERDGVEDARRKLAGSLVLLDESLREALPLVLDFMGLSDPAHPPPIIDPEGRQRALGDFLSRLLAQVMREPVMFLLDDLHWIDPASDALLALWPSGVAHTHGLLVMNFRPEYEAPWMKEPGYSELSLAPLGRPETLQLLGDLMGHDPSLGELAGRIADATAGNPFFTEEVVRSLTETGALAGEPGALRLEQRPETLAVPASVQSVLAARIDRLPDASKQLLQTASVIGRSFPLGVLAQVAPLADDALEGTLRALVEGEFVSEEALFPERVYRFRHPLLQEVAYSGQLSERRRALHREVARALVGDGGEPPLEACRQVGHHLASAGDRVDAAQAYTRIASYLNVHDLSEARRLWLEVRALLEGEPHTVRTLTLGVLARTGLLMVGWRLGASDEEAERTMKEGLALLREFPKDSAIHPANLHAALLAHFGAARRATGHVAESLELCSEAVRVAEEAKQMVTWASVASSMADSLFRAGRLHECIELVGRALSEEAHDTAALQGTVGMSPFLLMRLDRGSALAYSGQLERAAAELDDARLRVETGHRELEIWCLATYSALAELSGDPRGGLPEAQEACRLAERAGSSLGVHHANLALGRGLLACGRGPEAVEILERTVSLSREHRVSLVDEGAALACLGEAFGATGSWLRARGAIGDGLDVARERGTRLWQCRLELALARMLLAERGTRAGDEIEKTIREGLASAQETGAKSFEPPLFEVRAALASLRGDADAERADLAAARAGYLACGAHWHAARLAGG